MIDPNLKRLYDYVFSQTEETLNISLRHPITFNPHSIEVHITEKTIEMGVSDEIPILCGSLFAPLEDNPEWIYGDTETQLILKKKQPQKWDIIITSIASSTNYKIDPKSAFLIYTVLSRVGSEEEQPDAFNYLSLSAQYGFPPSLREFGKILLNSPNNKTLGLGYLETAANHYQDQDSLVTLGLIYSLSERNKPKGLQYLKEAIDLQYAPAFTTLAELLSPYSTLQYPEKNVNEAKRFLEDSLKIEETASAYHQLALIALYGTEDNPPNEEKAKELQEKAMKLDDLVPPLPDKKTLLASTNSLDKQKTSTAEKIAIGLTTVSLIAAAGYAIFRQIHKFND